MNRLPRLLALILASAPWATPALAQYYGDRGWFWYSGFGHMMFGGLTMVLFLGVIVALVVLLVRWLLSSRLPGQAGPAARSSPLEILQERFARGEIDKAEYQERKRVLSD